MKRTEQGFTVAELTVALALLSIVSFVIFNFLDGTTSTTNRAISNVNASQEAQSALRTVTQGVREANPIGAACTSPTAGYGSCLRFSVPRPAPGYLSCTSTVTYRLVPTTAPESVIRATRVDTGCATSVSTQRDLITVVNTAANPLFTYYDDQGKEMPLPPTAGAVAPVLAKSMKTTLVVRYRGQPGAPLVLTSTASLRNNR